MEIKTHAQLRKAIADCYWTLFRDAPDPGSYLYLGIDESHRFWIEALALPRPPGLARGIAMRFRIGSCAHDMLRKIETEALSPERAFVEVVLEGLTSALDHEIHYGYQYIAYNKNNPDSENTKQLIRYYEDILDVKEEARWEPSNAVNEKQATNTDEE